MTICPTCGAALPTIGGACIYEVPLDRAPGIGDTDSIATGKLEHGDHELAIARWRVHHPAEKGATPTVMAWARERVARTGHIVPPN